MDKNLKATSFPSEKGLSPDTKGTPVYIHKSRADVKWQPHYTCNQIQPIQFMQSIMTTSQFEGFLRGNVLKYVARYEDKDGLKDLEKAKVYLDWLIDSYKWEKGANLFPEKVIDDTTTKCEEKPEKAVEMVDKNEPSESQY